jgi:hypothetical protein
MGTLEGTATEFEVEASLLINEGGVHCVPVVFARPLQNGTVVRIGDNAYLNGARIASLDPARAAQRGPGLVAFVLEDPMDARRFQRGDVAHLESPASIAPAERP